MTLSGAGRLKNCWAVILYNQSAGNGFRTCRIVFGDVFAEGFLCLTGTFNE